MSTHADKAQENKTPSVANERVHTQSGDEFAVSFVDARAEVVAQKKRQELANNSPQVSQLRAFHHIANSNSPANQATQLQIMGIDHPAQQPASIQKKENNTLQAQAIPATTLVIQRDIKMKAAGTEASRTDGDSQSIEQEVTDTIAAGKLMDIEMDINHLRSSYTHREIHSAEFEVPDGGHEWRIGFEKRMMARLETAATAIRLAQQKAAAAAASLKEQQKAAKKKREAAKKAAEAAAIAKQKAIDKQLKEEERATLRAKKRAAKEEAAARKREADEADEAVNALQVTTETERQSHSGILIGLGVLATAAVLSAGAWFLA